MADELRLREILKMPAFATGKKWLARSEEGAQGSKAVAAKVN
jgi:hypothetical protein